MPRFIVKIFFVGFLVRKASVARDVYRETIELCNAGEVNMGG